MSFNSFNYTPPPAEIIRMGQLATGVLYAALIFVPRVKSGAIIGGLGSAAITLWVTSHASGDMGGLFTLIEPPNWFIMGGLIGGTISFISKSVMRLVRRKSGPEASPPDNEPPPIANSAGDKNLRV